LIIHFNFSHFTQIWRTWSPSTWLELKKACGSALCAISHPTRNPMWNAMWSRPSQGWKKSARNSCDMFFWHNFVWRNRIHCPFNILNWLRCPKNRLKIWPKIQRILKIYKGKKFPTHFSFFFSFILFYSQNWMNGCDCWGPDGRLDTKIGKFDLCHISISYASYVIIWHIMTYDAYDIEIWH
jgi:hypothetical protein